MGKKKEDEEHRCRWCGCSLQKGYICGSCSTKLKFVRQLLAMVKGGVQNGEC